MRPCSQDNRGSNDCIGGRLDPRAAAFYDPAARRRCLTRRTCVSANSAAQMLGRIQETLVYLRQLMTPPDQGRRLSHSRRALRVFWVAVLVVAAVEGVIAIAHRENDFVYHRRFGEDFWAGEPYRHRGNVYPLGRAAFDAGLALLDYRTSRAVCYLLALSCIAGTYWVWMKLTSARAGCPTPCPLWGQGRGEGRDIASGSASDPSPHGKGVSVSSHGIREVLRSPAVAVSLVIASPFLLRDLDECGLQLLLLGLLSAAAYALARGRAVTSGGFLAAAATYKATPMLFLPLLVWKRQWKAASAMACGILVLNLALPACHLGWGKTLEANGHWMADARRILSQTAEAYPSNPGVEPPKVQNLSLRAMFARYLETYPPEHPLHLQHPLFLQFGWLSPSAAKAIVMTVLVLSAIWLAWRSRQPWQESAEPLRGFSQPFAHEWALTCLLCALLSPVCWKQHLVLAIPIILLAVQRVLQGGRHGRAALAGLSVCACIFLLGRHGIVGRELSIVLMSYKLDTIALLATCFIARPVKAPAESKAAISETEPRLRMAA